MESVTFLSYLRYSDIAETLTQDQVPRKCTSYGGGLDLIVLCVVFSYVWAYGLKELRDCVAWEGGTRGK